MEARDEARGFFVGGLARVPLVRHGVDEKLTRGRHRIVAVYSEMLLQVSREYPGLPDPRTMTLAEIRFFYEGLRYSLHKMSERQG
jgi:hypothetical protein